MKCHVTSNTTNDVLINKGIGYKSYKEICSGEPKKVNLGFNAAWYFTVENNSLVHTPEEAYIWGEWTTMAWDWEILSKFFSIRNIEPNFLDCKGTAGWYDEELGGWTGCMGKV